MAKTNTNPLEDPKATAEALRDGTRAWNNGADLDFSPVAQWWYYLCYGLHFDKTGYLRWTGDAGTLNYHRRGRLVFEGGVFGDDGLIISPGEVLDIRDVD